MKRANTGLQIARHAFWFGMNALKIVADVRRHKTHENHHQLCDCLAYCTMCVTTSAFAKGRAAKHERQASR